MELRLGHINKIKAIFSLAIAVFTAIAIGWSVLFVMGGGLPKTWDPLQVLDIYYASGVALLLVYLFKVTDGPVKVELAFMKFEGASGPIIMWVIVFIAVCGGMKMLGLGVH